VIQLDGVDRSQRASICQKVSQKLWNTWGQQVIWTVYYWRQWQTAPLVGLIKDARTEI